MYIGTILIYLYFTWVFPFYATLMFHFTIFEKEILYFLFQYIHLAAIFDSVFADFTHKAYNLVYKIWYLVKDYIN